jgi:hypothetical protein
MFSQEHPFSSSSGMEPGHNSSPPSKYDRWRIGRSCILLDPKALFSPFLTEHLLRLQDLGHVFDTFLKGDGVSILLEIRAFPQSQDPDIPFYKGKPKVTPARCVVRILRVEGDCPPHVQKWGGLVSQPHLLGWWNGKGDQHDRVARYLRSLLPHPADLSEFRIA